MCVIAATKVEKDLFLDHLIQDTRLGRQLLRVYPYGGFIYDIALSILKCNGHVNIIHVYYVLLGIASNNSNNNDNNLLYACVFM